MHVLIFCRWCVCILPWIAVIGIICHWHLPRLVHEFQLVGRFEEITQIKHDLHKQRLSLSWLRYCSSDVSNAAASYYHEAYFIIYLRVATLVSNRMVANELTFAGFALVVLLAIAFYTIHRKTGNAAVGAINVYLCLHNLKYNIFAPAVTLPYSSHTFWYTTKCFNLCI